MGLRDNFRQAAKELLGTAAEEEYGAPEGFAPDEAEGSAPGPEGGEPREGEGAEAISLPFSLAQPRRKTVVAEGTAVRGNIDAAGGVQLYGEMEGDLSSQEDVLVSGRLTGDSASRSMVMAGGWMRGDVSAQGTVELDEESVLLGGVQAQELYLGGKVRGDLDVRQAVTLSEHAVVLGNITAQSLSVAPGAALQGQLRVGPKDLSAAFGEEQA